MKFERGEYVLASGRRIYANQGILGLRDDDGDVLTEGYDSAVNLFDEEADEDRPFTPDERAEIADAMITRWQAWKLAPPKL